jgi:hypothetical protein
MSPLKLWTTYSFKGTCSVRVYHPLEVEASFDALVPSSQDGVEKL